MSTAMKSIREMHISATTREEETNKQCGETVSRTAELETKLALIYVNLEPVEYKRTNTADREIFAW